MKWIIQENQFNEIQYEEFVNQLNRGKVDYSVVKMIPFSNEITPKIEPTGNVFVYGSISLSKYAKKHNWYPGCFDSENFDAKIWLSKYKEYALNKDAKFYNFGDIPYQDKPFFIRPCLDNKAFSGQTYFSWYEFKNWQFKVLQLRDVYRSLDSSTPVLIAPALEIYQEYRFWIIDNKVITQSYYSNGGFGKQTSYVDDYIKEFAQKMVDLWSPCRAYVLDLCTSDKGVHVLEINGISSAGLYYCDVSKLIQAMENMEL